MRSKTRPDLSSRRKRISPTPGSRGAVSTQRLTPRAGSSRGASSTPKPPARAQPSSPRFEKPPARTVYGANPVLELLRARPEEIEDLFVASGQVGAQAASEVFSRARDAGIRVQKVPRERLAAMADGGTHQGVLARVREFEYAELGDLIDATKASDRPPLIVVLDGIQDPQNLGAIVRSAHAFGAHGVAIGKDRAAQVTGVVSKASAGAVAHCPIARVVNVSRALEELKEAGFWVAAADVSGTQTPAGAKLSGPLALVVGAEGEGIREGVLKHCDFKLRIPMVGELGSLNASVSAAILLYEVLRQREAGSSTT